MTIGDFHRDVERGKPAERFFEKYCSKQNLKCIDVRNNPEYQNIDSDYIVDDQKWEVKYNLLFAEKGRQGECHRIELYYDDKPKGWWWYCKTDWFCFVRSDNSGAILIENNDAYKSFINNAITNGDHDYNGDFRFDYTRDKRPWGYITITTMRIYTEDLEKAGVNFKRIVNRKR